MLLVGDIDRGGVFAVALGTLELLLPEERALVKGFVINKFRGDVRLLQAGLDMLDRAHRRAGRSASCPTCATSASPRRTRSRSRRSAATPPRRGSIDVAVIRLPHISNFDDFDPLETEAGVSLRYVEDVAALGEPDLVILPGTKTTVADLRHMRANGLARRVRDLATAGHAGARHLRRLPDARRAHARPRGRRVARAGGRRAGPAAGDDDVHPREAHLPGRGARHGDGRRARRGGRPAASSGTRSTWA